MQRDRQDYEADACETRCHKLEPRKDRYVQQSAAVDQAMRSAGTSSTSRWVGQTIFIKCTLNANWTSHGAWLVFKSTSSKKEKSEKSWGWEEVLVSTKTRKEQIKGEGGSRKIDRPAVSRCRLRPCSQCDQWTPQRLTACNTWNVRP